MPEKRILLVEGEREDRAFLTLALQGAGYPIDSSETAAAGRRALGATKYALAIVGWQLPDGNGIDLADSAAKMGVRTIIVSGFPFGLPAGAADRHRTLAKPVSTYGLIAAVQREIGNPG